MNKMIIKIAKDFSRTPNVRYESEGEFSGESFRKNILVPKLREALKMQIKVCVDLDGTAGLGTSFLEESFGGLIREDHIDYECLLNILEFKSDENPDYIDEINEYMKDAHEKNI